MQLNATTLNGATLNGGASLVPGIVTREVTPAFSILWSVQLLLNGVDTTQYLTGTIRIEREEFARCIADFNLLLDAGSVNPDSYIGQDVEIHFVHHRADADVQSLRFRGKLERPRFNLQTRVLSCECSDQLNEVVEPLTIEQVDALAGGLWSPDVFEPTEGRSRWTYAKERLSTRPVSMQRSVEGQLQVTEWAATTVPHWLIQPDTAIFQSIDYLPVELSERINVVEVEADFRFIRLRERHQEYNWKHPDIVGDALDTSFCLWRQDTSEVPDIAMVKDASSDAGFSSILSGAYWLRLPESGVYCTPPAGWVNQYPDLLLRAQWTSALRWSQRVTEQYTLRLEAPASIAQAGQVISRDRIAMDTESDQEKTFLNATYTSPEPGAVQDDLGDFVIDIRNEDRRQLGLSTIMAMARVSILGAHRGNRFAFTLPTAEALDIRLEHTVRIEDQVLGHPIGCQAKVVNIIDEWDLRSGRCYTNFQLAVSQGGSSETDPLTPPATPYSTPPGEPWPFIDLPTQLGGHAESPEYDPLLAGFSGNYTNRIPTLPVFPRLFHLDVVDIPAEHMDEYPVKVENTYRVSVPTDHLEL
jgi:hypothetical protein